MSTEFNKNRETLTRLANNPESTNPETVYSILRKMNASSEKIGLKKLTGRKQLNVLPIARDLIKLDFPFDEALTFAAFAYGYTKVGGGFLLPDAFKIPGTKQAWYNILWDKPIALRKISEAIDNLTPEQKTESPKVPENLTRVNNLNERLQKLWSEYAGEDVEVIHVKTQVENVNNTEFYGYCSELGVLRILKNYRHNPFADCDEVNGKYFFKLKVRKL